MEFQLNKNKITVAYPQDVLALCCMLLNMSSPTCNKYGSCVALYKSITDSINSGLNG